MTTEAVVTDVAPAAEAPAAAPVPEKTVRVKKDLAPFIVGNWKQAGAVQVFTPLANQPATPVTDIAGMVKWVKENYGKTAGTYEFVRKHNGKLQIAVQQELTAKMV